MLLSRENDGGVIYNMEDESVLAWELLCFRVFRLSEISQEKNISRQPERGI